MSRHSHHPASRRAQFLLCWGGQCDFLCPLCGPRAHKSRLIIRSIWRSECTMKMLCKSKNDYHLLAVGSNWYVVVFCVSCFGRKSDQICEIWERLEHLHISCNNFPFHGLPLHQRQMRTYSLLHHKGVKDFLTKSDLINNVISKPWHSVGHWVLFILMKAAQWRLKPTTLDSWW